LLADTAVGIPVLLAVPDAVKKLECDSRRSVPAACRPARVVSAGRSSRRHWAISGTVWLPTAISPRLSAGVPRPVAGAKVPAQAGINRGQTVMAAEVAAFPERRLAKGPPLFVAGGHLEWQRLVIYHVRQPLIGPRAVERLPGNHAGQRIVTEHGHAAGNVRPAHIRERTLTGQRMDDMLRAILNRQGGTPP
jgi:hypothetical protein